MGAWCCRCGRTEGVSVGKDSSTIHETQPAREHQNTLHEEEALHWADSDSSRVNAAAMLFRNVHSVRQNIFA
jgi:hypothetical protein